MTDGCPRPARTATPRVTPPIAASGRRGSCRRGRRSRPGTAGARRTPLSRTSTYLPEAMLPSSTTSHSGPISSEQRARARFERPAVARRCPPTPRRRRTRAARRAVTACRASAARRSGVITKMPPPGDRRVAVRRARERARVGELAAEVQAAHEAEHLAERRARRRAGAARDRTARGRTSPSRRGGRRSWRARAETGVSCVCRGPCRVRGAVSDLTREARARGLGTRAGLGKILAANILRVQFVAPTALRRMRAGRRSS